MRSDLPTSKPCTDTAAVLGSRDRFYAVVIAVAAVGFFGLLAHYGLNIGEEGGTAYLIARTAQGQRPYLDFISGYTPGYFYWHALLLRLFGNNLMVLRGGLVLVHCVSLVFLFLVARTLLPRRWAVLAALIYPALLPVLPDLSCSFNVAYPAWYALLFWVVSVWLLLRWRRDCRFAWLAAVGFLAGLSFSFKPNTGLFHLAAAAFAVAGESDSGLPGARRLRESCLRWIAVAISVGGILMIFRAHLVDREGILFVLPLLLALSAWLTRRPDSRAPNARSLGIDLAVLVAPFAAVTLPWMVWYWRQLGWASFARDVLFLNTGYEQFFYQAYRSIGWRDGLLGIVGAALVLLPYSRVRARVRPGYLFVLVATGAVAAVIWAMLWAPMPEGFQDAVLMRIRDTCFGAVLAIHIALIAWLWRAARRHRQRDSALWVIGISCFCSVLAIYPRSDFFHLSCATAFTWIVGIAMLWRITRRWERAFPAAAPWIDRSARGLLALTLATVAWPQLHLAADVAAYLVQPSASNLVRLDLQRAPVLVPRRLAPSVRNVVPMVSYLQQSSGHGLFTFPNLDLLCFLSGRDTPARIGYFNPGWPDHLAEAEVVDALEERPPELAVVADPASLFFADAPSYYVLLRQFLRRQYIVVGRVGAYTVLRHHSFTAAATPLLARPTATSCDDPLVAQDPARLSLCLERDDVDRRALLRGVRSSEMPESAAAVAEWWGQGAKQLGHSLLALRIVGEVGDGAAAKALLRAVEPQEPALRDAWASALYNIALRGLIDPFQFGRGDAAAPAVSFDETRMRDWLTRSDDRRLRFFAGYAIGENLRVDGSRPDAAALLRRAFDGDDAAVTLASGAALVRSSDDLAVPQRLLRRIDAFRSLLPALLLEWQERNAAKVEPLVSAARRDAPEAPKELLIVLAGALRRADLMPLLGSVLASPSARLRAAAVWSLGQTSNPAALPLIHAAEADSDLRVRRFATTARRRLEEGWGSS